MIDMVLSREFDDLEVNDIVRIATSVGGGGSPATAGAGSGHQVPQGTVKASGTFSHAVYAAELDKQAAALRRRAEVADLPGWASPPQEYAGFAGGDAWRYSNRERLRATAERIRGAPTVSEELGTGQSAWLTRRRLVAAFEEDRAETGASTRMAAYGGALRGMALSLALSRIPDEGSGLLADAQQTAYNMMAGAAIGGAPGVFAALAVQVGQFVQKNIDANFRNHFSGDAAFYSLAAARGREFVIPRDGDWDRMWEGTADERLVIAQAHIKNVASKISGHYESLKTGLATLLQGEGFERAGFEAERAFWGARSIPPPSVRASNDLTRERFDGQLAKWGEPICPEERIPAPIGG